MALLTRKRRRLLRALEAQGREHIIHLFMYNARKMCPKIIHPERLYKLAGELFEIPEGIVENGEAALDLGQSHQTRDLVLAILHYMVLERKIVLSRRQFYWRDYPFEAKRRSRSITIEPERLKDEAEADRDTGPALQLDSLVKLQEAEDKDD